jgi:hypothetical protein
MQPGQNASGIFEEKLAEAKLGHGANRCAEHLAPGRLRREDVRPTRWPVGGEDPATHLVDRVEAFELERATVTGLEDLPDVIARRLVDEHD